eukprot:37729-Prymnesium_polylepis.1
MSAALCSPPNAQAEDRFKSQSLPTWATHIGDNQSKVFCDALDAGCRKDRRSHRCGTRAAPEAAPCRVNPAALASLASLNDTSRRPKFGNRHSTDACAHPWWHAGTAVARCRQMLRTARDACHGLLTTRMRSPSPLP